MYVVREIQSIRVWFAQALLSSSYAYIRKLIQRATDLAQQLEKPIQGFLSDRQDTFVTIIAEECPNVPHRFKANHFLRDLAKPILEKDSYAFVTMRKKVRGLRTRNQRNISRIGSISLSDGKLTPEQQKYAANIVLDY